MAVASGLIAFGASGASAGTLNISVDDCCNMFALTTAIPFDYGTRSGCAYTVIDNGVGASVSHVPYIILGDENNTSATFMGYFSKAKKVMAVSVFIRLTERPR